MRSIEFEILRLLGMVGIVWLTGCGNGETVAPFNAPVTEPSQLYMSLRFDHPGVTLSTAAPHSTIQLTATPRDALGNPMTGLPTPTYRSSDTTTVTVTNDGLVSALQAGAGVKVIAELVVGPVRHADTAFVDITALTAPPTLASLSIDPVPPDSAIWPLAGGQEEGGIGHFILLLAGFRGAFGLPHLTPRAVDTDGAAMSDLRFEYTSLDPTIAVVTRREGNVTLVQPGQVRMVAQATAYGITKSDTATFTVTMPAVANVYIDRGLSGAAFFRVGPPFLPEDALAIASNDVRIVSNGMVAWTSFVSDTTDVTFDDPTNLVSPLVAICDVAENVYGVPGGGCGVGNFLVPPMPDTADVFSYNRTVRLRQFSAPGIYAYHSTRTGAAGRVIVTPSPTD